MYYFNAFDITLDNGHVIVLDHLAQWMTYERLLEGVPRHNMHLVKSDCRSAMERFRCPVVVVDARPIPLPLPKEQLEAMADNPGLAWIPKPFVSLNRVACMARFQSLKTVRGEEASGSELAMIWYQEGFCMPIDPLVLPKIKALDWDRLAQNFEL